jgi:hypothetical protein
MAAGSIVVDLLMKTGSFETDTKRAQKSLKNFEKSVDDFAVKVGAGVAVAGAALSAMVLNTTRAAEEINRFAQLSGTTTESFQMMAAGASTVGIQTDKLADIFKDVQDKVGDFMQTGGGALADFFENIAPKVGVTAEQFRKLSGPQALQLYISSLEKANLSQSDMIFYLEAIASDSSLLLPLMRDNGKAMQEFGEKAKASGQIMSDDLIKNSVEFRRQMEQVTGILKGFANQVTALVLPALIRFSIEFRTAMENANGFFDALGKFGTINPFRSDTENLKIYRQELEKLKQFREQQVERGGLFGSTAAVDKDIADVEAKIKYLETLQQRLFAANPTAGGGRGFVNPPSVVAPAPSLGVSAAQKKANEAALEERKKFDEEMQKFEQAEFNRKLEITQLRLDEEAAKELAYQELLTEYEQAEEDNRRKIHAERLAQQEEDEKGYWGRWLENAEAAMMSFNDLSAAVIQNFTTGFGNAFEKMVFDSQSLSDSLKNLAEGMARSVINALGQMAAQWLAYQAVQLIVGKTTQASASAAQTFQAMTAQQMAAINAFASTAAIPIVGPALAPAAAATALVATAPFVATVASLSAAAVGARATGGPVSADAPYLVGERGPELFVPNTAGKIVSNDQMNKGSGTVVNQVINVTTGVQQTVRAEIISLMPQIANAAKSAVADARQRGGAYASSMR